MEGHQKNFGVKPYGMWPSEGGVSRFTLKTAGRTWLRMDRNRAGGLANSLQREMHDNPLPGSSGYLYKPYLVETGGNPIHCFFRDDSLSE